MTLPVVTFTITFPEDGSQMAVDIPMPPTIDLPAGMTPAMAGQALATQAVPVIAAHLEQYLPAAKPAYKAVEHDEQGRIVGLTTHLAIPAPSVRARDIAVGMVPALVAHYTAAFTAALHVTRVTD